jgi:hypothetical protein
MQKQEQPGQRRRLPVAKRGEGEHEMLSKTPMPPAPG